VILDAVLLQSVIGHELPGISVILSKPTVYVAGVKRLSRAIRIDRTAP